MRFPLTLTTQSEVLSFDIANISANELLRQQPLLPTQVVVLLQPSYFILGPFQIKFHLSFLEGSRYILGYLASVFDVFDHTLADLACRSLESVPAAGFDDFYR